MSDDHRPLLHGLNNLLAVILSYSELLAMAIPAGEPARIDVAEIERATRRAADIVAELTRR